MKARLLVLLGLSLATTLAHATILTYEFSGEVTAIMHDDSSGIFGESFSAGDAVHGTYTLDTTQSPDPLRPGAVSYAGSSFDVNVGAYHFSGSAEHRVFNDDPLNSEIDAFSIINETSYSAPSLGDLVSRTFFVQFFDSTGSVFSSTDMVIDPPPLSSFSHQINGLRLDNRDNPDDFGGLYFSVDSLRSSMSVPEPATVALLAIGLAGIGALRRRA